MYRRTSQKLKHQNVDKFPDLRNCTTVLHKSSNFLLQFFLYSFRVNYFPHRITEVVTTKHLLAENPLTGQMMGHLGILQVQSP